MPDIQDWQKNHRTIICLQADEETMTATAEKLRSSGEERLRPFIDDDFPEDFGWTAIALPPMTREAGQMLFGCLKLA